MLESYEAILDHNHLHWIKEHPSVEKTRVRVTVLQDTPKNAEPNGAKLARFLRARASSALAEKFGDPVAWQREQRKNRPLPGRE